MLTVAELPGDDCGLKFLEQGFQVCWCSHLPRLLASLVVGNVNDLQSVANLSAYHESTKRDFVLISELRQSLYFRPRIETAVVMRLQMSTTKPLPFFRTITKSG